MASSEQNREFVRLWTAHGQRVYSYIHTLIAHAADADEIYQETGVTLWEKFDEFTVGSNFQAWACRVAFNKVRNFRQLRRHRTLHFGDSFIDLVDETMASQRDKLDAQHHALADCFAQLNVKDQELLEQRYCHGATTKGIAQAVGRSTDAVYKALARIHRLLIDCVTKKVTEEGAL